jgi:predicted O-methyltransferase YrrM
MRSYQHACVLMAAAELDVFALLAKGVVTAESAAAALAVDVRGMRILLDALAAIDLVNKDGVNYSAAPGTLEVFTATGEKSQLAMAWHQANCLRSWAQLARVVRSGRPTKREASIRGETADYAAFIEAMDNISGPAAQPLIDSLPPLKFTRLLDVGGASGTWTIAFLRRYPEAKATLFDLPHVIPQAQERLSAAGVSERVRLVGGDYTKDELPPGCDLAWVSAIIHQNSREQNRALFKSVFAALSPGGQILIRDLIMDSSRTRPAQGALFAINMLVNTEGGDTFTFEEMQHDLASAGFTEASILRNDGTMNSVVAATKPAG